MRVNVYAEEMTDRIELVEKSNDNGTFHGIRFYLYLPVTVGEKWLRGPFMHHPDDDDSAAVTFWGKSDLRPALRQALEKLDAYYAERDAEEEGAVFDHTD